MGGWDIAQVKSHIRGTAQKLAQLQEHHDSLARRQQDEIATLLGKSDIRTARALAEQLFLQDVFSDVLARLEIFCDFLLGSFSELTDSIPPEDSQVYGPLCAILYAATLTGVKELIQLRDIFVRRYGHELCVWVTDNYKSCVPPEIYRRLGLKFVPQEELDKFLHEIARSRSVPWTPLPTLSERTSLLTSMLDPSTSPSTVDLDELRRLCSRGLPDEPSWLRPRAWKLLWGILPPEKELWIKVAAQRRGTYEALAQNLLDGMKQVSASNSRTSHNPTLSNMLNDLRNLPRGMTESLADAPRREAGELQHTGLELRQAIEEQVSITPEVPARRSKNPANPPAMELGAIKLSHGQKLAYLQLLFMHRSTNPVASPYLATLAAIIHATLSQDSGEHCDVDSDAFWMLGEISQEYEDLADRDTIQVWMRELSIRIAELDPELSESLKSIGLEPSEPLFSYRWIVPLLSHTLPMNTLLPIWDGLFSSERRTPERNYQLERLIDVCSSMLILTRGVLVKATRLRSDAPLTASNSSFPLAVPGFEATLVLLRDFPMNSIGGPNKILETAVELPTRNRTEKVTPSILSTVTEGIWHGLSLTARSGSGVEPESDAGVKPPTPPPKHNRLSLSERLRTSFTQDHAPEAAHSAANSHRKTLSLRDYATQFRDSDTAATISKLSTNWRAMAFAKLTSGPQGESSSATEQHLSVPGSRSPSEDDGLPERPVKFRSPRESFSPYSRRDIQLSESPNSAVSLDETPWTERVRNASADERDSRTPSPSSGDPPRKKRGPKPLLLNPSNLMSTSPGALMTRSATSSPIQSQQPPDTSRHHSRARDSQSSFSSVSEGRRSSEFDFGRVAPLRRSTAMFGLRNKLKDGKRKSHTLAEQASDGSPVMEYSPDGRDDRSERLSRGWNNWNGPDSPGTASSPPLSTPRTSIHKTVKAVSPDETNPYDGVEEPTESRSITYTPYYELHDPGVRLVDEIPASKAASGHTRAGAVHSQEAEVLSSGRHGREAHSHQTEEPMTPRPRNHDDDGYITSPKSPRPKASSSRRGTMEDENSYDDILSGY